MAEMTRKPKLAALVAVAALATGCDTRSRPDPFAFKNDVETNVQVDADTLDLTSTHSAGTPVELKIYRGQKHVVLVATRGMTYPPDNFCMYCSGQTSRLIANYKEFAKRGAEVLLVIPGPKKQIDKFLKRAREQADD